MSVLSVRLTKENQGFLTHQVHSRKKVTKGKIVNIALEVYRKILLQKELMEFASNNEKEDLYLANLDFINYLDLVNTSDDN